MKKIRRGHTDTLTAKKERGERKWGGSERHYIWGWEGGKIYLRF
jgi:hypothetical protein